MFALKGLMAKLGSPNIDCRQDGSALHPKFGRASYLFNSTIAGIDQADAIMIIGSNPRLEAPVLNARIRKRWLKGDCLIGVVGERADLTYGYNYLGAGAGNRSPGLRRAARQGQQAKPMFILGAGAFARPDGQAILACREGGTRSASSRTAGTVSTSCIPRPRASAGSISGSCRGRGASTRPRWRRAGALDVLFNLGADEIEIEPGAFVVYIGTHGDRGAHRADVILPGAAYTEKTGIYVNTEGRPQFAERAVFPPGDAREDWSILRALSDPLGAKLPFDSLAQLRAALAGAYPYLRASTSITPADVGALRSLPRLAARLTGRRSSRPFPISISPTRSRALRASWPNVRLWRRAFAPGGGIGETSMTSVTPSRPASPLWAP